LLNEYLKKTLYDVIQIFNNHFLLKYPNKIKNQEELIELIKEDGVYNI
jgi:hypothetical protein